MAFSHDNGKAKSANREIRSPKLWLSRSQEVYQDIPVPRWRSVEADSTICNFTVQPHAHPKTMAPSTQKAKSTVRRDKFKSTDAQLYFVMTKCTRNMIMPLGKYHLRHTPQYIYSITIQPHAHPKKKRKMAPSTETRHPKTTSQSQSKRRRSEAS